MKKLIHAAEDSALTSEEQLTAILSTLKDNFNYASDGIEKLAADGDVSKALSQATALNDIIDQIIAEIAQDIAE